MRKQRRTLLDALWYGTWSGTLAFLATCCMIAAAVLIIVLLGGCDSTSSREAAQAPPSQTASADSLSVGRGSAARPRGAASTLAAVLPSAQSMCDSCLSSFGNLTLLTEMAQRHINVESVSEPIRATWRPPTVGSPVVWYGLRLIGIGQLDSIARHVKFIFDTTYVFTVPAYIDSVKGECYGVDADGEQGPWSERSLYYPVGGDD